MREGSGLLLHVGLCFPFQCFCYWSRYSNTHEGSSQLQQFIELISNWVSIPSAHYFVLPLMISSCLSNLKCIL